MHICDFEAVRMRARYGLRKGWDKGYLPLYGEFLVVTEKLCRMGQSEQAGLWLSIIVKDEGGAFFISG